LDFKFRGGARSPGVGSGTVPRFRRTLSEDARLFHADSSMASLVRRLYSMRGNNSRLSLRPGWMPLRIIDDAFAGFKRDWSIVEQVSLFSCSVFIVVSRPCHTSTTAPDNRRGSLGWRATGFPFSVPQHSSGDAPIWATALAPMAGKRCRVYI
jgi:hypothetical protein